MPALLSRKSIFSDPRKEEICLPNEIMESWDPVSHSKMCSLLRLTLRDSRAFRSQDKERVVAIIVFDENLDN